MANYKDENSKLSDSEIRMLVNTYLMYDDDIKLNRNKIDNESNEKVKDNLEVTLKLMDTLQQEIVDKLKVFGLSDSDIKDLVEEENSKRPKRNVSSKGVERVDIPVMENATVIDDVVPEIFDDYVKDSVKTKKKRTAKTKQRRKVEVFSEDTVTDEVLSSPKKKPSRTDNSESSYSPSLCVDIKKAQGNTVKYDFIPLPSDGKCYKEDLKKIPVAYLTANDENMIMSPNLYQDGSFLDHLIQHKVISNKIDTDKLIPADREAILVWLRIGGYGNLYPVTAKDNETGKEFVTNIDLSKLKYKKFKLTPDEDGYFDYTLPVGGNKIKFKYLSYAENKELTEITLKEDADLKKQKLVEIAEMIGYYTEEECENSVTVQKKVDLIKKYLKEISDDIDPDDYEPFNHLVTNRLSMSIMSVDGVTDRDYIDDFVESIAVMDAKSLREYISENEPGLDLNVEVDKPESLGGGSMKLFLAFDQFMFLNVAK